MIVVFCLLLIGGIIVGQAFDLSSINGMVALVTATCLSYIMIEVGLEFSVDKRSIKSFGWDFVVAFTAAAFPAIFWFGYFIGVLGAPWQPALLSGLSSAPTSAGVLFSMLMAAGLAATWVYKKAQTLAVLDDLVVLLLLTPLGVIIHGFQWQSLILLALIAQFLFFAFRFQNSINCRVSDKWLLVYAFVLTEAVFFIKQTTNLHLEVLIPAFTLGCMIHHKKHEPMHTTVQQKKFTLDVAVKGLFMFLVGLSFPKMSIGEVSWGTTIGHVLALTVLANLGKCFPMLCYRKEVPLKERLALSVTMFPRGEVGAAVLLIALGYGFGGYVTTLAMLSLAFNLILTGVFVWFAIKLLKK